MTTTVFSCCLLHLFFSLFSFLFQLQFFTLLNDSMTPFSGRKGGRCRINDAMPSDGEMAPFPVDLAATHLRTGVAVIGAPELPKTKTDCGGDGWCFDIHLKKIYMQWHCCWWQQRELLCKRIFSAVV